MIKICLVGRLTKDMNVTPEFGVVDVAVDEGKDRNGEKKPASFWTIFLNKTLASKIGKYLLKGTLVAVAGKPKQKKLDKGIQLSISVDEIEMLGGKDKAKEPEKKFDDDIPWGE